MVVFVVVVAIVIVVIVVVNVVYLRAADQTGSMSSPTLMTGMLRSAKPTISMPAGNSRRQTYRH